MYMYNFKLKQTAITNLKIEHTVIKYSNKHK